MTACASGNGGSNGAASPPASPSASATSPVASDPLPGTDPTPSAGAGTGTKPPASPPARTAETDDTGAELKELLKLAQKGRAPGIAYAAHTGLIDDVEKDWGKADKTEAAGKGIYATYAKKNAVIGFNKGSQIFDVRSSDPKLQKLTLKQIERTLGKPADTTKNGDDAIYVYNAGKQFQLKFVIPKSTGQVDHISVFSPQDAVNNMAG
ncbi:YjgB family protein [Cohnella nanjingensis]|uniref:YjgB family protein n=2 Tax=Cohnella nanjingensis TaxID=1387779 RepID=A0A7X0VJ21_9BACL|nr:YjgB family protein [Cohnella nanjingensis]